MFCDPHLTCEVSGQRKLQWPFTCNGCSLQIVDQLNIIRWLSTIYVFIWKNFKCFTYIKSI